MSKVKHTFLLEGSNVIGLSLHKGMFVQREV